MFEHYWTVLCRKGVIDKDSNNISLQEVLEQINILGPLPAEGDSGAIPGPYEIITLWGRANYNEPVKGIARYVIEYGYGDDMKAANEQTIEIDMTKHNRSRSKLKVQLLPIFGEGLHRIHVSFRFGWKTRMGRHYFSTI